jgi:hypothetical protein
MRLDRLDETRRTEDRSSRLGWFDLFRRWRLLRGGGLGRNGVLGEHVAARKRDASLSRETLDERARDNFLDGARGALQLDSVIALEQRQHFLARRAEQFRDLVNPNRCQIASLVRPGLGPRSTMLLDLVSTIPP